MSTLHVRDVMRTRVCTITPDTPLPEIAQRLQTDSAHRLPVMGRSGVVGMVTQDDISDAQPSPVPLLEAYERPALLTTIPAATIMSRPVITIAAGAPLTEAARLMLIHKVRGLPVLRNGQLVGIITASDILRIILNQHAADDHQAALSDKRAARSPVVREN